MTRDDQEWLDQQRADHRPSDHAYGAIMLALVGFVALFWCAACAWTIRLIEVARA